MTGFIPASSRWMFFLCGCFLVFRTVSLFSQEPALAVVEKKAGMVGFYTADGKRIGEVKVGNFPHEVVFSPDRRYLYVTDNGLLWMTDPGDGYNTISIIELASRKKAGVIDLGSYRRPHGIAVLPRTGHIVTTIENPNGLLLVDPDARKVLRKYDVKGENPHMVTLSLGAEYAYVSNANSGTLAVLNLGSGIVEKLLKTGSNPQGSTLTADGKYLYLANAASDLISIIETLKNQVVGEIKTGVNPARVSLTPDGKTLVYNLQRGEGIGFADVESRKQVAEVRLPGRPLSLSLSQDGRTAYLGLQDSDKIAIVSVPQRKVVRIIATPAGAGPDTIMPLF
jgi:YVTN family beta-propeller protein